MEGAKKYKCWREYIKLIQDRYDGCTTSVIMIIGSTESFEVKVGLHQGSALSPLLFINTIILCQRSQTAGRNSCSIVSGGVSNYSYRLTVHPVTSSRLSSA